MTGMDGALVVREGVIVGKGYHCQAGGPHAETIALDEASGKTDGSTLYVNLEPCNHHGNTPPCTDAIVKAGIKKIVCSTEDPNPRVNGKGLKRLIEEGIEVSVGHMANEARRLNEVYCKNMREELPFIALKIAQSLDGRIATRQGSSKWITGPESRKYVHMLRNEHAAVIVGIGTVRTDDPLLTVRDVEKIKAPLRVVLDTHLSIADDSRLVNSTGDAETLIYTALDKEADGQTSHIRKEGVLVETIASRGGLLDLREALRDLYQRGVPSALIEGGTRIFTSFLSEGLVDKLYIFIGPVIIGGGESYPSFDDLGISNIEKAFGVDVVESRRLGQDTLIICYPSSEGQKEN
jgi:diaminohydroxyphosphoribosylaminopyrimidine deaminase/5-amino-6-(5-phosphoribosylamino)uracil reductase